MPEQIQMPGFSRPPSKQRAFQLSWCLKQAETMAVAANASVENEERDGQIDFTAPAVRISTANLGIAPAYSIN